MNLSFLDFLEYCAPHCLIGFLCMYTDIKGYIENKPFYYIAGWFVGCLSTIILTNKILG